MSIQNNIKLIKSQIPKPVTLIAVSKTKSVEEIVEAYDSGVRDFGENKVQELLTKIDHFGEDVRWHLIGHLQRNKVKYIVGKVFLIHSLDSIKLLQEIERQYEKAGQKAQCLIEINIGNEPSKTGISQEALQDLLLEVEKCSFVEVRGLMTIIPRVDESASRSYFKLMHKLWLALKDKQFKNITMDYLSMGMTQDYMLAIEEGSNMVRVGEGIFGKRNTNNK